MGLVTFRKMNARCTLHLGRLLISNFLCCVPVYNFFPYFTSRNLSNLPSNIQLVTLQIYIRPIREIPLFQFYFTSYFTVTVLLITLNMNIRFRILANFEHRFCKTPLPARSNFEYDNKRPDWTHIPATGMTLTARDALFSNPIGFNWHTSNLTYFFQLISNICKKISLPINKSVYYVHHPVCQAILAPD